MKDINYVDNYMNWLKKNILEKRIDDKTYRITFPFLDANNTMTELYIIKEKNKYTITDDGYTFSELELINFDFSSERRKKLINDILLNHGVYLNDNNELYVECTNETMAFKKHLLIQCMLKISDLSKLSHANIKTLFNEQVENFFYDNDIRFIKDIGLVGKSKLQSNYDFAIGQSRNAPERVIKLINSVDTTQIKSIIFSWEDVKETRSTDAKLYTFINDNNRKASKDNLNALQEYNISPVMWSEREKYIKILSA